ncbi:ankyrin repeat-containing protein BDA1 [Prunus persica]|nr:ankyrin repeat-containing protein BDA1 [Prunus persica]
MDPRLKRAAQAGDIDVMYTLIKEDAKLLDLNGVSFVDTPLHVAASEGHILFAMEIMRLKPSFARKSNQDGFSPIHLALQNGNTQMVLRLLDVDTGLVRVSGREGMTPLHYVAKEGNIELLLVFLSTCPKSFEDVTIRNETALHIALKNGKVEAFELLVRWLTHACYEGVHQLEKRILNWKDDKGNTLLHIATIRNQPEEVELLLNSKVDVNAKNSAGLTALDIIQHQSSSDNIRIRTMLCCVGAQEGASLPNVGFTHYLRKDQRLMKAAQEGDIDGFYSLIQEDSCILERIDQVPFVHTPLHVAASAGHTHFALEMMRLKPQFTRKQNKEGFSALHLALKHGKTQTVLSVLSAYRDIVRVKGREGRTLLHCVAEIGNLDLLAEFLAACPESIIDLTNQKETALHIAAKNDKAGALEVLLGWIQHVDMDEVLQWTDVEGNTVLHIATARNQFQVMRLLIKRVDLNAKNLEGLTALDISLQGPDNNTEMINLLCRNGALGASSLRRVSSLADSLRKEMSLTEKWILRSYLAKCCMPNEKRNALLVIAVLIATATFQAVLNPPAGIEKGYSETPHNFKRNSAATTSSAEENAVSNFAFHSAAACVSFLAFNTMAFLTSISEIWFHLPQGLYFLIKLGLPLLLCYMLSLSLTAPVSSVTPFYVVLLFLSQVKAIVRVMFFKRTLELKLSLLKHCPSLHREMES